MNIVTSRLRLVFVSFSVLVLICACTKPVYTTYFEEENYTQFTTHPVNLEYKFRELTMLASRKCDGLQLCTADQIKFKVIHEDRFAYLKGKDFTISADGHLIDLNHRDYNFMYDIKKKANDGTSGVAKETWLIWISVVDFEAFAKAEKCMMKIGDEQIKFPFRKRENFRILLDNEQVLVHMDDEQKRTYGEYAHTPISEAKRREQFEKKASTEAEEATWKLIKETENEDDLRFFLKQYPESPYAIPAKLKLQQLERVSN